MTLSAQEHGWLASRLESGELAAADASVARLGAAVRQQLLAAADLLARDSEAAAVAFYRNAARVYAGVPREAFARWFDAGANLASRDRAAAEAFFALESRQSVSLLRASGSGIDLDAEIGVWRKLIEMVSGEGAVVRRVQEVQLRPSLEKTPEEAGVGLPERIERFETRALNRNAYRFLALQLAGRREFGTYADEAVLEALQAARRQPSVPSALEELFLIAEGVRVQARIAAAYPGTVAQTIELAEAVLEHAAEASAPALSEIYDAVFAAALSPLEGVGRLPWLPPTAAKRIRGLLAPVQAPRASANDSLAVARQLLALFATQLFRRDGDANDTDGSIASVSLSDLASDGATIESELQQAGDDSLSGAFQPGSDATHKPERAQEGLVEDGSQLATGAAADADDSDEPIQATRKRRPKRAALSGQTFVYDEWDHLLGDYRSQYCRVHEIALPNDSSELYERTRAAYSSVLAQVRHQFERIRPERYRPLRGLEHGEDFDLNALIENRVDARARRTPNNRVYTARTRQQRDVATLFLVDMSASTEQPYAEPGEPQPHRIIDTLKEALVVMSSALDDLGDDYAIYGFSSHGRERVEVYPVKDFRESLGEAVKARIGSLAPKNGTRMGAALRHVLTKFSATAARSKHLILLSDGFPQDQEYGSDRRTHTYGIQDTAVALRELTKKGVTPFCITVDRAGNDYLREMCAPQQYLIIEELDDLPKELPKIYRRVVQS